MLKKSFSRLQSDWLALKEKEEKSGKNPDKVKKGQRKKMFKCFELKPNGSKTVERLRGRRGNGFEKLVSLLPTIGVRHVT
jgi:predicted transcriptional regulator